MHNSVDKHVAVIRFAGGGDSLMQILNIIDARPSSLCVRVINGKAITARVYGLSSRLAFRCTGENSSESLEPRMAMYVRNVA